MHFSEIANAIKKSDFKRKAVTTQAIHNELIKDSRFVLIGRGIYALNEWGYKKGTVADIITEVIKEKRPVQQLSGVIHIEFGRVRARVRGSADPATLRVVLEQLGR